MDSFKLLVVQHKPEVTQLWAFKFGRKIVDNKSVVPD